MGDLADEEAQERLRRSVFEGYVLFDLISWRILDAFWQLPRVICGDGAYERWVARGPGILGPRDSQGKVIIITSVVRLMNALRIVNKSLKH